MKKLEEKILRMVIKFRHSERGASAVEYALLVALIAVVIIGAVTGLGSAISSKLATAASAIGNSGS
jgi:pilus assembly protein Flp/PilA